MIDLLDFSTQIHGGCFVLKVKYIWSLTVIADRKDRFLRLSESSVPSSLVDIACLRPLSFFEKRLNWFGENDSWIICAICSPGSGLLKNWWSWSLSLCSSEENLVLVYVRMMSVL